VNRSGLAFMPGQPRLASMAHKAREELGKYITDSIWGELVDKEGLAFHLCLLSVAL